MKTTITIDPGITGAIAIWQDGECRIEDMPTIKRGKTNVIDAANLTHMLEGIALPADVWIEDVHAMPRNGSLASFSLGRSVGTVYGVCAALGFAVHYVAPQMWKKGLGIPPKADKDASRSIAIERIPSLAPELGRKKDHGRADAVCIGLWVMAKRQL